MAIAGCDTGSNHRAADPINPSLTTENHSEETRGRCLDATGHATVTSGALTIGPFNGDALNITQTQKEKVWVGTQRRGVHQARLVVAGPGQAPEHSYSRQEASAEGFQAFFPGLVDITEPGLWTITIHAGRDTLCVQVQYR